MGVKESIDQSINQSINQSIIQATRWFQVDYKSYLLDFKSLVEEDLNPVERRSPNTTVELSSSLDENRVMKQTQVLHRWFLNGCPLVRMYINPDVH